MSTSYPGALDSFVNPTATDTLDSATVPHAAQHDNINDAMAAVQVTLGVNPQGGSATVVARLTALDSTVAGKAATDQTMYVGTTSIKINRSSASQTLTGVSIDGSSGSTTGNANTVTNGVYTNVSNTFTTGTQIIATGSDATVGLRVKRNSATQSANIVEVTQSDGTTILAKIDSAGAITTAGGVTASGTITTSGSISTTGGGSISSATYVQSATLIASASGVNSGQIQIGGSTSGTAIVTATATAGGTHTFPATGGTIVNSATTSLPNVTSVRGTTIPISATLLTDATTLLPNVTSVNNTTIPASSTLVTSSNYRQSQLTPSGAVDIIPRLQVSGTRVVNSGTISFTGFTPVADMTLSKISVNITAVTGTPTLQFGVYSISAMTATCLGISSVSSAISAAGLVELSLTSSVSLTAGTNYLIAFLPVGGTSATFSGSTINNSAGLQGNGTSGVFAPLIAAQSSSTTKTVMTTVGSTETLSGTVVAGFVFARLNNS
jgi:hypothetical protein